MPPDLHHIDVRPIFTFMFDGMPGAAEAFNRQTILVLPQIAHQQSVLRLTITSLAMAMHVGGLPDVPFDLAAQPWLHSAVAPLANVLALSRLPDDVWLNIASRLTWSDGLRCLSLTCRSFYLCQ